MFRQFQFAGRISLTKCSSALYLVLHVSAVTSFASEPTFADKIAPLVHEKCAPCHRPGGVGPFSLLTYEDVSRRAAQIEQVTASRYMPPWLPESQPLAFSENRQLSQDQILLLQKWVAAGAPQGHVNVTIPEFPTSWYLGKPDLELEFQEGFPVPMEGTNVFRNFVLSHSLTSAKYIAAYEVRPDPIAAVHHAVIQLDPAGGSRELDAEDELPGFPGMVDGRLTSGKFAQNETSQVLGWTPGKVPRRNSELAWKLNPGTDLILQLHLQPLGRPAQVTAKVGLYFSDHPPQKTPFVVFLSGREIDVPAGERNYLVEQTYQLPVDVELWNIYPHAHFICRQMLVTAQIPTGESYQLIKIPDWDFNWHDDYSYLEPVSLPRGTVIRMEYRYDNSADNPRNPHQPPRRIIWGERSDDEMADLALLVVPKNARDLPILQQDYVRYQQEVRLSRMLKKIRSVPEDARLLDEIGQCYFLLGQPQPALEFFAKALRNRPELAELHVRYGLALRALGRNQEASNAIKKALELQPAKIEIALALAEQQVIGRSLSEAKDTLNQILNREPRNYPATTTLVRVLLQSEDFAKAAETARAATVLRPESAEAWELLSMAYKKLGQAGQSLAALQQSVTCEPGNVELRLKLVDAFLAVQQFPQAENTLRDMLQLDTSNEHILNRLGIVTAVQKKWSDAERYWQLSLELEPDQHETLANLARALYQQGKVADSVEYYRKAMELPPIAAATAQQFAWILATNASDEGRDAELALRWARFARDHGMSRNYRLWDTLAAAHAAAGEFEDAAACAARSLNLLPENAAPEVRQALLARKAMYESKQPFVEPVPSP